MRKWILNLASIAALFVVTGTAQAASVIVDAKANSSSGGTGANSGISLTLGQFFTVTVAPGDLWSAGALPRWSNSNGLTGPLFATGSDESGELANTLIGSDFGTYTQEGLSAPYGTLVGRIGAGTFFVIGTNFAGPANAEGFLSLYYWDSNNFDNSQFITANVTAVPVPAGIMLLGSALMAVAGFGRRRGR